MKDIGLLHDFPIISFRICQKKVEISYTYLVLIALFTSCVLLFILTAASQHIVDDAFITMRYSYNFIHHGIPTWNVGGELVDGYTSFLFMSILFFLGYMGLDLVNATVSVCIVSAFFLTIATYMMGRGILGKDNFLSLFPPLVLPFFIPLQVWTAGGLEGVLFALLLTVLMIFLINHIQHGVYSKFYAPLFLLIALCRPEGIAISFIFSIVIVYMEKGKSRKALVQSISLFFILPFLVYFTWHYLYYGYPFPNTYYAKLSSSRINEILLGINYFLKFLFEFAGIILALFAFVIAKGRLREIWPIALFSFVFCSIVIFEGGDLQKCSRFFLPLLPILSVLPFYVYKHLRRPIFQKILLVFTVFVILAQYSGGRIKGSAFDGIPYNSVPIYHVAYPNLSSMSNLARKVIIGMESIYYKKWPVDVCNNASPAREASVWLGQNMPEGTLVCATNVGALAYYSKLPIHDIYALNDKKGAHMPNMDNSEFNSWGKFNIEYALEVRPAMFVPAYLRITSRKADGINLKSLNGAELLELFGHGYKNLLVLLESKKLLDMYTMRGLVLKPGRYLNMFVRNDLVEEFDKMGFFFVEGLGKDGYI